MNTCSLDSNKRHTSPWSDADEKYLADNARRFTAEYMGIVLGRTTVAVKTKASRMGIPLTLAKFWTREDMAILEKNAGKMKTSELAALLDRDVRSIRNKAACIGLSLRNCVHSDEDVELCRALFREGLHYEVIAEKMEIPAGTVRSIVYGQRRKHTTAQQG